ncbi:hypothetical protein BDY21DRAFT_94619 [Lineolata rhizophorae]|uniref:Secreted protein n=1 Tax=Lineolata rhizophorae TaxID=578093 RepID=A0A6A6NTM7_9PEZI|nr:hypothetical protein BDY21DRAFT_94619 [Lineolata rhizophorae]
MVLPFCRILTLFFPLALAHLSLSQVLVSRHLINRDPIRPSQGDQADDSGRSLHTAVCNQPKQPYTGSQTRGGTRA